MVRSIEEKVEEHYKKVLDELHVRHYGKTESINLAIDTALKEADSKSGNSGNNYPDIKLLLEDNHARRIPVMIEAKGTKGKLIKLTKDGYIEGITEYPSDTKTHKKGDKNYSSIVNYAVNGALHYGNAILNHSSYKEVLIIGINGSELQDGVVMNPECKAYYVSEKNGQFPKEVKDFTFELLKNNNIDTLFKMLDELNLTETELENLTRKAEETLESKIKSIHQALYDDEKLKTMFQTNEKLYLFCGLIMAGLSVDGVAPLELSDLKSNNSEINNDGQKIITYIKDFLAAKRCSNEKIEMIMNLIEPVFKRKAVWTPYNGESVIKGLFGQVKEDIIPCFESNLHLDFTGRILNTLGDWVHIENDVANDVVLTPRYVTKLMVKMARTDMNSYVWDRAMGSAGFLVAAMDVMVRDAREKIKDVDLLEEKMKSIKENQILGVEILGNIYILAVLNMILMGDGSSNMICGDSHVNGWQDKSGNNFPATVFLLNPPYSAEGKGFIFVEESLRHMTEGYACILIQENAGSGQGGEYTKSILKNNTLVASIHMPNDLFGGKASVQTAIYVFKVAKPHEEDDLVKFIDFSNDGYTRQNRKKSTQEVNLRDTDNAQERYAEVEAIVLGKKPKTNYYTKENGLLIEDTITLDGKDWTYAQHKKIDLTPTEEDFKKTVADYLAWKVANVIKNNTEVRKDE